MDGLKKSFKSLKWYEWLMIIIMIVIAGISVYNALNKELVWFNYMFRVKNSKHEIL